MKIKNSLMILLVLILLASFSLGVVSAEVIEDSSVYNINHSEEDVISLESSDSSVYNSNNLQSDVISLNNDQNICVSDMVNNNGNNNSNDEKSNDLDENILKNQSLSSIGYFERVHYSNDNVNIIGNNISNIVTNDTFFDFFDADGVLKDNVSSDFIFQGEFANLNGSIVHIVINRPVSIVCDDVVLRNIGIHLVEGSSGSNLTGFSIISNKTSNGIWLSDSNYNHITNCSINLAGSGKFAMPIIRSSYNVIDNCDIYENGSSVLVLSYANFNNITNCNIKSASSNVVYINCYDILDFKAGVNGTDYGYNNSFVNNNVSGVGTMFCIGFQIMGSDNKFINNNVVGASSAFSSPAPSNWANYTNNNNYFEGNHVENCTAGFVFGSQNNAAVNNTVVNSGSGISASNPSIIVGNNITCNGTNVGIKLTGSNILVENNTIGTAKGAGITSTKSDNKIINNSITSDAQYAITLGSGSNNVIEGNYLKANSTIGDSSVFGTGVNTIKNNTPESNVVTNDTFFYFFDVNGTLKDDIPNNLIFKGEFEGLLGINTLVINKSVVIVGDDAVLNNIAMQFVTGSDGSVVDNLTFINHINGVALIDLENVTNVVVSNNNLISYGNSSRCVLLNNATECEVLSNIMFMNSSLYNSRAVLIGGNSAFNNISSNDVKVADFNGIDINPYVGGGHDNLVFNNTITSIADVVSSWNYAIQLGGPNNTAMNNTIYHVFMGIFSATNGNGSVIVGNNITDLSGGFSAGAGGNAGGCAISAGIKNIVENNTITDYDLINTGINTGVNCTVSGNTIIANATNSGININSGSIVSNNVINSNYTNSQLINSNYHNVVIVNNTLTSSNGTAIKIKSNSAGSSVVGDNIIVLNESVSSAIEVNCSNVQIIGNVINIVFGVGISSIKSNNTMMGNNISAGAQYAITLANGSDNTVTDNYLKTNSTMGDSSVFGTGVNTVLNNTPKEITVNVSVDDVIFGDKITGSLGTLINGTISIVINGTTYNCTVTDGEFDISAFNLGAGNYSNLSINFISDDGIYVANDNISFNINKLGVVIAVDNISGKANQDITALVKVTDAKGNPLNDILLKYTVSNETKTIKVVNGTAKIVLKFSIVNNYILTAMFEGNENYADAVTESIIKVACISTKFTSASSGTVYNANYYKVTLKDANGKVLVSKKVKITILGKTYTVVTDSKGVAKVKVSVAKKYLGKSLKITYKFAGDKIYNSANGFSTIKVVKTVTKITKAHKLVVKNHKYFYVKLTTKSGKILPNKIITMKSTVSGKVYNIKTNSKGIAKINLWVKKCPLGKYYKYIFKYAGSSIYKPCVSNFKVKIV